MSDSDYANLIEQFTTLDEVVCEEKAIALGQQAETSLEILTQLLQNDNEDVRFWAVRGLWAHGSSEAIATLAEALGDETEMVRSGAALALGELKAAAAVEALGHLITTDPTATGNHAADALSKIGVPSTTVLIDALHHEVDWVRRRAAKAIIPLESRNAIEPLFYALEDESYMVRHYAEAALARMGVGQMVYFKV